MAAGWETAPMMSLEEEIIERLRVGSRGEGDFFFDVDFGGTPSSLYTDEEHRPAYDANLDDNVVVWLRPHELAEEPEYFVETALAGSVMEGRLGDAWLLGALAVLASHSELLLVENLFGSDPEDFRLWGVFSCRFYVDGQWEEVVTDTRIPALQQQDSNKPLYGSCLDRREQWIALLEKAYAKLKGSYEALHDPKGSLTEVLVELTGGSAEELDLAQHRTVRKASKDDDSTVVIEVATPLWEKLCGHLAANDVLAVTLKVQEAGSTNEAAADAPVEEAEAVVNEHNHAPDEGDNMPRETALGLLPERAYAVVGCKTVLETRFVQLRNPWSRGQGRGDWRGPWSNTSTQWDDFPEVVEEIDADPNIKWNRNDASDPTFFIALEDFIARFSTVHVCRLFPDESFQQYKIPGAWKGKTAGGPPRNMSSLLDGGHDKRRPSKETPVFVPQEKQEEPAPEPEPEATSVAATAEQPGEPEAPGDEEPKAEETKRRKGAPPPKLAAALAEQHKRRVRADTDASWFNCPQVKLSTHTAVEVHLSLLLTKGSDRAEMGFQVLRTKRQLAEKTRVWSLEAAEVVGVAASPQSDFLVLREVVLSAVLLEPGWHYWIVPHAMQKGKEADFVLRIFSSQELKVATVEETSSLYVTGSWEGGTAGGPPLHFAEEDKLKLSPRWSQNPQYLLKLPPGEVVDGEQQDGKPIDVKLVLRRTDQQPQLPQRASRGMRQEAEEATTVGLVVCKAKEAPEEEEDRLDATASSSSSQQGQPVKRKSNKRGPVKKGAGRNSVLCAALGVPSVGPSVSHSPSAKKQQQSKDSPDGFPSSVDWAMDNSFDTIAALPMRKVVLEHGDWHLFSSFNSGVVATLTLPGLVKTRIPHGLVISPCLSEALIGGEYTLEVHSDGAPLTLESVPEAKSKTVASEWTQSTAGGSHLHGTSKINPRFKLTFQEKKKARLTVVLSRPASQWKKQSNDTVGCMMGFYLNKQPASSSSDNDEITHQGRPWSESPFVPMHSVSTPTDFKVDTTGASSFIITPATFSPGKLGRFYLSVTSDADFTLTQMPPTPGGPGAI